MEWRIPLGFQIVPVGVMFLLLFGCRESPVRDPFSKLLYFPFSPCSAAVASSS